MSLIPALSDLHKDADTFFQNDQLNLLLNQPPAATWLKKHKIYGNTYLPIDKVEFLLTRIFQRWRVEVLSVQQLFQSVCATVRLHYRNPLTGEWEFMDGVGACEVQVDAGSSAADMGSIKSNAIVIAAPKAKTAAIKDAAANLGTIFGKDLNRKDTLQFESYKKPSDGNITITTPAPSTSASSGLDQFSDL